DDEEPRTLARKALDMVFAIAPPFAELAAVIGGWYFATYVVLDPQRRFLLPPPHSVVSESFFNHTARTEIFTAAYSSARVAALGLLIATVIGIATAIAMSQ